MAGGPPTRRYLVERYLPGFTPEQLSQATSRLAAAASELAAEGEDVRYLGSTALPEEESCFCRFEAQSREGVERACVRADVPFARIVEAEEFTSESTARRER